LGAEKKARAEKKKLEAAENAKCKARKLSAPTPAEKLEDARRKLNDLKAAEGAKAVEIAGAESVVIESPPAPDVTIDLYLSNRVSSIQNSGPSVSMKSVSSSSSNRSRALSSMLKDLPSTSASTSKSSNSSTSTQKRVPPSTAKSSSSSKTKTKEGLEEENKEMSESIQATMKGNTSSKASTSRQKQPTTNNSKPSTSTQKQLLASTAKLSKLLSKKKTEELKPEKTKTGMFRKIMSAIMGRK
jgi:hypothetical protein